MENILTDIEVHYNLNFNDDDYDAVPLKNILKRECQPIQGQITGLEIIWNIRTLFKNCCQETPNSEDFKSDCDERMELLRDYKEQTKL